MNSAEKAIRNEIERRERELDALRKALAALTGDTKATGGRKGKGTRKPKTAAQKKALSLALKAAWKKRKSASKKAEKAATAA
jgi:hypothetical protein